MTPGHPFFARLASVFDRSWSLGRVFGAEIRLHVTTLFLPIYGLWRASETPGGGWFPYAYALAFVVVLYFLIVVHEFGHIFAGRRFGVPGRRITLSPLGGLAHLESPAPSPRAEIAIALAGPATNAVWYGIARAVAFALPPTGYARFFIEVFAELNLGLLLFNLLPFFPLDGGRTFRGLLALKLHPNRATLIAANVGIVGGALLLVYGLMSSGPFGFLTAMIGMMVVTTCLRERLVARMSDGPYGAPPDPWSFDADAWRQGRSIAGDEPRSGRAGPGLLERRRQERAEREELSVAARRSELEAEVDRLLDKVATKGGLAGLTQAEQNALKRASEELKKLRGGRA